jgi:hypothetical protein
MPPQAKKLVRPHLSGKKLGEVACACHPRYGRNSKNGRIKINVAWTKSEILSPKKK